MQVVVHALISITFCPGDIPMEFAREAVRQAVVQLEAVAGAGRHDAGSSRLGVARHPCYTKRWAMVSRATSIARAPSAFSGPGWRESRAFDNCTIVDDGTLPDRRGSLAVDDEGTPG